MRGLSCKHDRRSRPSDSTQRLIEREAYRQIMSGEAPETLAEFAQRLLDWFIETYPGTSPTTLNIIEDWIRETWHRRHEMIQGVILGKDLRRLPELFCGIIRKPHRGPTAYPVACALQAWAAAAPFAFLAACLGMDLSHRANSIRFVDPVMPDFLDHVNISHLSLRDLHIDHKLQRHGNDTTVNLLSRNGDAKVMLVK